MLSFVITAFNEMSEGRCHGQRILDCIAPAQAHEAIGEVVIVDDASEDFEELALFLNRGDVSKLTWCHNLTNRGVFGNKLEAIACARADWVITCDSDNVMDKAYLDKITSMSLNWQTWYCASFARPRFDYRKLIGTYDLAGLQAIVDNPIFRCFFNTGNQVVQRTAFMQVFGKYRDKRADLMMPNFLGLSDEDRKSHHYRLVFDALDSFLFNFEWVKAGNRLAIVDGLEYDHHYTTGNEGNYMRSPSEKEQLGEHLYQLLKSKL